MLFRETIKASLSRGRIDAVLRFQSAESSSNSPELNLDTINQLMAWSRTVQSTAPGAGELSVAEILKWPGVLTPERIDETQLGAAAKDALANALSELVSRRQREGRQLALVIKAKVAAARDIVIGVQSRGPELEQHARQRLNERGYSETKVEANVEWELLGGAWNERENDSPWAEFDTSGDGSEEIVSNILYWISDGFKPASPEAVIDWVG